MILHVVAVGRMGDGPESALFRRYAERLRPHPLLRELPDGRGTPAEIARREAGEILAAVPRHASVVALDSGGAALDSQGLARCWEDWRNAGAVLAFVIGGAEGLHASVLAQAELVLSLGALTWPHLLARAMLIEQLYRAQCIVAGHPYHRVGRP